MRDRSRLLQDSAEKLPNVKKLVEGQTDFVLDDVEDWVLKQTPSGFVNKALFVENLARNYDFMKKACQRLRIGICLLSHCSKTADIP